MRHLNVGRKLGRKTGPRSALIRGLATSFILKGKIQSTESKIRELRPVVEKYITISKKNTIAARRQLSAFFYDEVAVNKLLKEIGPKYLNRKGGYTRIVKLNNRRGDNASMAILELV